MLLDGCDDNDSAIEPVRVWGQVVDSGRYRALGDNDNSLQSGL